VQKKLLDLYTSPHMSSSVKLHIIAALGQTTRLKEGLDWLLGRHHVQVWLCGRLSDFIPALDLTKSCRYYFYFFLEKVAVSFSGSFRLV